MPITAQAEKKLRHDRSRSIVTASRRASLRNTIKEMRKNPTPKQLSLVFTILDKAVKNNIIHANKAARLKSRLSKLVNKK